MSIWSWLGHIPRLALLLTADISFVLASRPPYQADSSEIQKDNQAFIDHTISRVPLLAGPLIFGLTLTQLYYEVSGDVPSRHTMISWEMVGAIGMIAGGQLRLWCYRVLGRFFTFNVCPPSSMSRDSFRRLTMVARHQEGMLHRGCHAIATS